MDAVSVAACVEAREMCERKRRIEGGFVVVAGVVVGAISAALDGAAPPPPAVVAVVAVVAGAGAGTGTGTGVGDDDDAGRDAANVSSTSSSDTTSGRFVPRVNGSSGANSKKGVREKSKLRSGFGELPEVGEVGPASGGAGGGDDINGDRWGDGEEVGRRDGQRDGGRDGEIGWDGEVPVPWVGG
ncbi:hypothetical protein EX30DRAFT_344098 [Ascodesmis nigricans]|uniref:Uncharacterized protein n=1 Tax=Ascodesmis nigricans TaxID=341454 RepID=A0A4V3SHT1_9PEZI|nr:hypothetical protein EX30DRAFT_344098 [Ascodesmis nigricans]